MSSSKRIKPEKLARLMNWDEVDAALKEIAELQRQVDKHQLDYERAVEKAKEARKESTDVLLGAVENKSKQIRAFCEDHPEGFGDRRSREMTFGQVGFRLGNPTVEGVPSDKNPVVFETFLASLRSHGLTDCIRAVFEVDKSLLRQQKPEILKSLGVTVIQKDAFFLEAFREDLPKSAAA